jgi:hypothetical protein
LSVPERNYGKRSIVSRQRTSRRRRGSLGLGRLGGGGCSVGGLGLGRLLLCRLGFFLVFLLLEGSLELGLEVVKGVQSCEIWLEIQ